jgi:secretion/DNA translocation related TadE-like protein
VTVGDRGSGSALAVGIIGAVAVLTAVAVPASGALAARQAVAGAADAAALAAADTAMGVVSGDPCARAAEVAAANDAELTACEVDGYVVTVAVSRRFGGFAVGASATAGPPAD